MKLCRKCNGIKALKEFHKRNKGSADGRQAHCKVCKKEYDKKHFQENKEHIQKVKRKYRDNNIEKHRAYWRKYYRKQSESVSPIYTRTQICNNSKLLASDIPDEFTRAYSQRIKLFRTLKTHKTRSKNES